MSSCKLNLPKSCNALGGRTVKASGRVDVILFRLGKALAVYNFLKQLNLPAALASGAAGLMGSCVATRARRLSAFCFPAPFAKGLGTMEICHLQTWKSL